MAPFYGWGSTVSRLEPLQGGSLLFTNFLLEILINFQRICIIIIIISSSSSSSSNSFFILGNNSLNLTIYITRNYNNLH